KVVQRILDSYARVNNHAIFTIIQDGDLVQVVPKAVKGATGKLEPFEAMLNTKISLPPKEYNLDELVSNVLAQVSLIRGIPIVRATVPINMFAQTRVTAEANSEAARDVLVRAFSGINGH